MAESYDDAVDVIARRAGAAAIAEDGHRYLTRKMSAAATKAVRARLAAWAGEVGPSSDEYEQAFDVVAHGGGGNG